MSTACECNNWPRLDVTIKAIEMKCVTNHHPNCKHYNDSLIPIWRVASPPGGGGCIFDSEKDAMEFLRTESEEDNPLVLTKEQMHREIFENLPEFGGF